MSRPPWRPTTTINGWHPKLSPDGLHVLFGFWQTHVANLVTEVETEVFAPAVADGHHPRLHPLGWLDNRTFISASEEGPAAVYSVSLDTMSPVQLVAPEYRGVSFGNAEGRHWGVMLQDSKNPLPYCLKDGVAFHPEINQYGCAVAGDHLLTADLDHDYELMHFVGETLVRRLPSDNLWFVNQEGDVTTGYYGPVKVYPFDRGATMVDGTVTPWRAESPGWPVRVDGALWIWNASDDVQGGLVMGRRLGELNPIVLRNFPAVAVHARYQPATRLWVVAGNNDKGGLQVRWVPMDAPREVLVMPREPIVRIGRPMWGGFYVGRSGAAWPWGTDTPPDSLPGNCYLQIPDGLVCRMDGTPFLRYVTGSPDGDADAIERAIVAAPKDLPIMAYVPHGVRLPSADVTLGLECYLLAGETTGTFEANRRRILDSGRPCWAITQCFTSNPRFTTDLRLLPPVVARLARDYQNLKGICAFNGSGRATGYQDHPEVHNDWRELFAGIPSAPEPEPEPEPDPIPEPDPEPEEIPMLTDEQLLPIYEHAGAALHAADLSKSAVEWTQGCREAADCYRGAAGRDPLLPELMLHAQMRAAGVSYADREQLAIDAVLLRRG